MVYEKPFFLVYLYHFTQILKPQHCRQLIRVLNMELTVLFVIILAVVQLTTCCWPPHLNPELATNRTLLDEAIKAQEANPAAGWTHVVGEPSPRKPWPAGSDGLVRIRYCYRDERAARNKQWTFLGFAVWEARLGSAGPQHRHRLARPEEFKNNGATMLCRDGHGNWNPAVPSDTLEIRAQGHYSAGVSSMGYSYDS
jgi:hypothetical protein